MNHKNLFNQLQVEAEQRAEELARSQNQRILVEAVSIRSFLYW